MSNMLEQAIVDAAALREAALKNAEQSIIEKYAPQIKEAVKAMLDDTIVETRMYQGRTVEVIHEADEDGNVTVSESGGKPFTVKESDLSEATEDQILQEEEMDAAMDTSTAPPTEINAPPAWDSRYGETSSVSLTAMLDNVDADGNVEIDLDAIELSLSEQEATEEAPLEEPLGDLSLDSEEAPMEEPLEDEEAGLDDLLGDDDELQLQEIVDAIKDVLEEEIEVDDDEELISRGMDGNEHDETGRNVAIGTFKQIQGTVVDDFGELATKTESFTMITLKQTFFFGETNSKKCFLLIYLNLQHLNMNEKKQVKKKS